eukprot:CAMPEP_0179433830 /NCGR_PEP_ID=MMETSP0799-20121207/18173_1 /TAXON_ID=46947 /ORGANISM="Geminigera cryophila, Strain CCMP2564" /LENGTH=275 /DNA_ID=CAMNT_0021212059 /DNA_START=237 /DNA_END=1064 /DNA_ORIENTATION=+
MAAAPQAYSSPQQQPQHFQQSSAAIGSPYGETQGNSGFGDTGHSSIRLHAPSGGNNSMGSSFGWDEGAQAPRSSPPSRMQEQAGVQTSSSMKLAIGSQVMYKQMGKAGTESKAVVIDIEPVGSRKDNYRIRFEDGRERNTGEDKLTIVPGVALDQATRGMAGMGFSDQENMPPAQGYQGNVYAGDPVYSAEKQFVAGGQPQQPQLRSVEGAAVGELQIGQAMMYRQTTSSEPQEVIVLNVELPSSNGFMRTKTFYQVQFSDGRTRETTIDKLKDI